MQSIDINRQIMPTTDVILRPPEFYYGKFPAHFKWGSSSSAYQAEGACSIDGKGQTWWDQKNRPAIIDKTRGDMAADSYRRFEQDVMLLKAMNATCYKFSLSWSRILPNGTLSEINKAGLDYYDDLINTLLENGIEPIVVLYHWDFPQALVDKHQKSWLDEDVPQCFESYAKLCFRKFGDRVKRWVPIHDPWTHSVLSFGNGNHPPGIRGWSHGAPHKVYKNLLKAHTLAYNIYDREFRIKQRGSVGLSGNSKFISALMSPTSTEDLNSKRTGPSPWTELMKSPADFIVLDYEAFQSKNQVVLQENDSKLKQSLSEIEASSSCRGLRGTLNTIKNSYGNPELILGAYGIPLRGDCIENLVNLKQIEYFKQMANEVLKSVVTDGCNVVGLLTGSLVDCWEWEHGFTVSYGLHKVNFDHPEKPRTPRSSAKYLKQLFKMNGFSKDWDIGTIALN